MLFKDISYLELWRPFCSAEQILLCIFTEGIMRNNSVKNFDFGPVVQEEMPFKDIFIWRSGGPFIQRSGTICAILVEGIMRNNSVKSF